MERGSWGGGERVKVVDVRRGWRGRPVKEAVGMKEYITI